MWAGQISARRRFPQIHLLRGSHSTAYPFVDFSTPFSLEPNDGASVVDVNLGQLPLGSHTLTLTVDVNSSVGESNESNNIRQRTFNVVGGGGDDHGNVAAQSTPVVVPSETAGSVETGTDRDWFNFVAVGGKSYILETMLGTLQDSTLRLYNTNGITSLAFDDDGGPGLASRIEWTAPADGTYYLEVLPFNTGQTGTYTLKVSALGTEDFGDAPTAAQSGFASSYPTLLAENGARHTPLAGFRIGMRSMLKAMVSRTQHPTSTTERVRRTMRTA